MSEAVKKVLDDWAVEMKWKDWNQFKEASKILHYKCNRPTITLVENIVVTAQHELIEKVTKLFDNECKKYKNTPIGLMIQGIKEKIIQELNS